LPQASDQLTAAEQFRDRCVLGEWAVWQGDFENGRKHLEELRARVAAEDRLTRWHNEKCSALLSAALAVRQRRPDWSRELAVMDSILLVGHPPFSETEHFWLAEARLYQAAGLLPEARNRVNRGGRELRYLPSYLRAEAELAEQAGDTAAAVRSRNRLLQWRVIGISQQTGGIPPSTLSGF
jgi:hypothetical protein